MLKREFDSIIESARAEFDRRVEILSTPDRIFGEFYDTYAPNLLQQLFELAGYPERELYDVIIEQLQKLEVLRNCRIERSDDTPTAPLSVIFKNPEFQLLLIDIKGKKYVSIVESVYRGMNANILDAERKRDLISGQVNDLKVMVDNLITLAEGDLDLSRAGSFFKKQAIKKFLTEKAYPRTDIDSILRGYREFIEKCKIEIDKRQVTLAEAQKECAGHANAKRSIDENPYLNNTVNDLIELLQKSGYTAKMSLPN